jgi:hypothetical protein
LGLTADAIASSFRFANQLPLSILCQAFDVIQIFLGSSINLKGMALRHPPAAHGEALCGALRFAARLVPSDAQICGECATGKAESGSPTAYKFEPLTMRR